MLKLKVILFILILPVFLNAQKRFHEIGGFLGASYYMGDLNPKSLFRSPSPVFGMVYKLNLNPRYTIRINGTFGTIRGTDESSNDGYQLERNQSFSIPITEFTGMFEFNFFPYKPESQYEFISPYVTLGAGALIMPSEGNGLPVKPVIPFGIGLKYAINKRLGLALEWTYRKTFTDFVDQLPNNEYSTDPIYLNKQRSYSSIKDWYSFAGISLTYKFALGSSKCPAYGK